MVTYKSKHFSLFPLIDEVSDLDKGSAILRPCKTRSKTAILLGCKIWRIEVSSFGHTVKACLELIVIGWVAGSSANVFVANHDTERVRSAYI